MARLLIFLFGTPLRLLITSFIGVLALNWRKASEETRNTIIVVGCVAAISYIVVNRKS